MGILAWTESSSDENKGVDHLGMRVAAESAYSKLIDFTTTVTWRPRYYSFLSWAARKAFIDNGGDLYKPSSKVDHNGYKKSVKKIEYGVVAATLLNDENASQVAGTEKVKNALSDLVKNGESSLTLAGDHLKAPVGGLSIYAGVMRLLGLLASSEGFDIPLPNSPGNALADAFERSLSSRGIDKPFDPASQDIRTLKEIGECCSINNLEKQAQQCAPVRQEAELIKQLLLNWDEFHKGKGKSARRILSIGILLESRNVYPEQEASLALFREFTLLGAACVNGEVVPLKLPSGYNSVLAEWQMYQVHAYITYALESGLSLVLLQAKEMQEDLGDRVPQTGLISRLVETIPEGFSESDSSDRISDLDQWWSLSITDLVDKLERVVQLGREALCCEPEFFANIHAYTRPSAGDRFASWVHDTFLLFLIAAVRTRYLFKTKGSSAWAGTDESFRLPPNALVQHLEAALSKNVSVDAYAYSVISDLVIKQHHQNALRKLLFQPDRDTAKFTLEGPNLIPIGSHNPGTSSPRYENALLFLKDLGFLTQEKNPKVTEQGYAVLQKIRGALP